jgi:RHS repeat-associated protein
VLGRLTASQDAEQYAAGTKRYSYTKYDPLGRIFETGQVAPNSPATDLSAQSGSTLIATLNPTVGNFPDNIVSTSTLMTQVVHTYYGDEDRYLTLTPTASLALKPTTFLYSTDFSRSRVVAVSLEQNNDLVDTTFNHATFYNYDIHGNVKELSQHNPDTKWAGGHEDKKHMYYDYDLISGKVNKVSYQPGYADQFFHKYEYDADNRITHVYTSSDDVLWDNDAKYFYYKHGPLARMEIGNDKVQGYDYAYTLQGWIKGTNSELLTNTKDIGKDANTYTTSTNYNTLNARFAKDAAAYNLNYFTRTGPVYDYLTASTTYTPASASFKADALSISTSTTNKPLYNGNIGHMTTSYLNMDPSATHPVTGGTVAVYEPVIQLSGYRYDQLNRITDVNISKDLNTATNTWGTGTTTAYKEAFTYDKNGNIITAKRNYNNNGTFPTMDDLSYTYSASTNKLSYVDDAISLSAPTDDIEDQAVNNYTMYLNGNLKADAQENITNINWSIYGKPLKISKTAGDLTFRYDAMGNRISKRWHTAASSATTDVITYYVRDAQGNTMATYQEAPITGTVGLTLEEHNVYGSSRLGNVQHVLTVTASPAPAANPTHTVGEKNFELSNHLGNVLSVVNDHKATVTTTNSACVGVMDFAPGYDVTSWELQVNGVTATSLAIGAVQVQYTSGAITGINPAFGPNVTPGDYLLEFDWDPGNCDASDNLQIEPFDVQWSGGFPVTFYMSTPFWATGTVPAKGHYTFTYTPSATASDIWTHIAFNNWGAATNHTFVIDNISMCPLSTPATIVDYHNPDIVSHSDYYAFGANKPGTQWTSLSSPYRYTFNGKEKDGEAVSTSGGTQDYGARIYNPSLGRFLSVDPITHQYPQLTPFQFAGNTPIACADIDGEEPDPKYVQTNYGSIVLEKPDGYTLQQLLDELKKPLTPKTPAPVEVPSVFSRLLLTVGFVLTPHSIGEETTSWEYEQMQEAWRKMHAKPEDIIIITTDPSTLTDEYLGLVRSRLMNGTASDQDKLYRSEVQKRIVGANDKYVVNPQHDPSSGKYKSNKSVLPSNHQALWEKRSYYDEKKDEWWSVEGEGKKAVYHRFKGDNGIYHWNGSSNGTTKSGTEYKIKQDHIPNDAKKQSIRKF